MKTTPFLFVIIILVVLSFSLKAQDQIGVAVMRLITSTSGTCSFDNINSIAADAGAVMAGDRRFLIIKPEAYKAIVDELDRQKDPAFLKSRNVVEEMIAVGAQYMFFLDLVNCSITESRNKETGNVTYNATLEVEVSKINTGTSVTEFSIKVSGSTGLFPNSNINSAVNSAVSGLKSKINDAIVKAFPIESSIVEVNLTKNGKSIENVVIKGGQGSGLNKNTLLDVIIIKKLDGEIFESVVGTLKVVELNGQSFATCTPTKGGNEIKAAYDAQKTGSGPSILLRTSGTKSGLTIPKPGLTIPGMN